jgi:enediyne biosynthesis protein E4
MIVSDVATTLAPPRRGCVSSSRSRSIASEPDDQSPLDEAIAMAHSKWQSPRVLMWSAGILLMLAGTTLAFWLTVSHGPKPSARRPGTPDLPAVPSEPIAPPSPSPFRFHDATAASGVDFSYQNGEEAGLRTILESLGGGVAIFDYDSDGWPDLFFTGGGGFEKLASGFRVVGRPHRLYRNLGHWRFRDVTVEMGLNRSIGYSHGASVGDYDNDGDPDLLVTAYEGSTLYRNEAGHRFVDVTREAGLTVSGWSTSAAWADVDRDGRLDLYVTRYVDWSPQNHPPCTYRYSGEIDICAPSVFKGLTDLLYHNEGGGRFREVGRSAGLQAEGKGLGVVACDLDGDRDIDFYVVNDTTPNWLYRNRGNGTFDEVGFAAGVALSAEGIATGSMGADASDADGDGDFDLWVSNYEGETNELFRNDGGMIFTPIAMSVGLGAVSRPMVGWGTGLFDLDNDSRLDVVVANGHLMHHLPRNPLAQRPLLFHQNVDGRFDDVGPASGHYFAGLHPARGCAAGDLDNDGDLDLVIVHQNEPVVLLRNDSETTRKSLRLRLEGVASNGTAIGAVVAVKAAGRIVSRPVIGGGSYLSQNDERICIGLRTQTEAEHVEVFWPSGRTDRHDRLDAAHPWLLREGQAPVVDPRDGRP